MTASTSIELEENGVRSCSAAEPAPLSEAVMDRQVLVLVFLGFLMSEKREIEMGERWVRWGIRGLREWEVGMKMFSDCAMV